MTQTYGADNCFVMWNQNYNSLKSDIQFTRIWIDNNGNFKTNDNNLNKLTRTDGDNSKYSIVAARSIWLNARTNWLITVNLYESGNYYLTIYKEWNCKKEILIGTAYGGVTNNNLQKAINNIHITTSGDNIEYTYIDNLNQSYIKVGYFDTTTSEISITEKNLSFNDSSTIDIDIYSGDIYGNYAYLYAYDYSHNHFPGKK